MGHSTFHHVLSAGIIFVYHDNETIKCHTSVHLLIDNYKCNSVYFNTLKDKKVIINLLQTSFTVHIKIVNSYLLSILVNTESGNYNVIELNNCTCSREIIYNGMHAFFEMTGYDSYKESTTIIQFKNCYFINIFRLHSILFLIDISSYFNAVNIVLIVLLLIPVMWFLLELPSQKTN